MALESLPATDEELANEIPGFRVETYAKVHGGDGIMADLRGTWNDEDQLIIAYEDVFNPAVEESHTVNARIQGTYSKVVDRGSGLGPLAAIEATAQYASNLPMVEDNE